VTRIGTRLRQFLRRPISLLATFDDESDLRGTPRDRFAQEREKWKFFAHALTDGAGALKETLAIDEANFRLVAGPAHADARSYFLYGVLDEIQQAGVGILKWDDFLGPEDEERGGQDGVVRMILEATLEEQSLWQRKLTEVLIDLVCFCETNEGPYFRHYLLLRDFSQLRYAFIDLDEFYAAPSRNLQWSIDRTFADIAALEDRHVDLARCWYRKDAARLRDENVHPAGVFSSVRTRLQTALGTMTDPEKLIVGMSYDRVFGEASRDIHFRPSASMRDVNVEAVAGGMAHVGTLGINAILRVQQLLGVIPEGMNRLLRDTFDRNEYPRQLMAAMTGGRADVGDFVLAYGDLGEVVGVSRSRFGYRSYRVRYLAERPLPEVDEDWFVAQYVRRLYTVDTFLEGIDGLVAEGAIPASVRDRIRALPRGRQQEAVREALTATWEAGLRDYYRRQAQLRAPAVPMPPAE
jgi:hypothetical protein